MFNILYKFLILGLVALSALASDKPHIILINIDDLGWTDLSYQGSEYYESPNIDALAKSGMIFDQGYAAAANCAPSRACLISGEQSSRTGVYTVGNPARGASNQRKLIPSPNTDFVDAENFTIADAMNSAGYLTATLGKYHVAKDPLVHGWDINVGGREFGGPYKGGYHSPYEYPNLVAKEKGRYLCDHLTDEAIAIFKEHGSKQPVFMYFPYYTIHAPIEGHPKFEAKYKAKAKTEGHFNPKYAAMIEALDKNIGRLVAALEEQGLREKTLIMFTSDNGGHMKFSRQEPLRAGKGSYYEGGIRVPFFASWPGVIKAGSRNDTPVTGLDFYPTVCELAGVELPADKIIDGDSFLPLLKGGDDQKLNDRAIYWHFPIYLQAYLKANEKPMSRDPLFRTRPGSVIRHGKWKLHHYFEDDGLELYDINGDRSEKTDLSKEYPEVVSELRAKLDAWRQDLGAFIPTELNPDFGKKVSDSKSKKSKKSKKKKSSDKKVAI
ncbi:sulfatase [Lentisphaera marina]|uniref:sulfatase n=1 Tax=Lentisphaera marina TaxID=1111041 RepID=UPI002366C5C4|nr:sulfatase [Lentisphaera marina]MDD7986865.1 sulfatase [Lentisphaera marina]